MLQIYTFFEILNLDSIFLIDPIASNLLGYLNAISENAGLLILFYSIAFFAILIIFFPTYKFWSFPITISSLFFLTVLDPSNLIFAIIAPWLEILLGLKLFQRFSNKTDSSFSIISTLISICLILQGALLSGPLALLGVLLVILLNPSSKSTTIYALLVLGILTTLIPDYSSTNFFDYPRDSMLSNLSPITHLGAADFGMQRYPFPMNYSSYLELQHKAFKNLILLSAPLLVLILLNSFYVRKEASSPSLKVPLLVLTIIGSHFIFSPIINFKIIEEPIIRSFPGLIWRPYPALFPSIAIFLLFGLFTTNKFIGNKYTTPLLLASIFIAICLKQSNESSINALQITNLANSDVSLSRHINKTPSKLAYDHFSKPDISSLKSKVSQVLISKSECIANSNIPKNIDKILDGNLKTRWSTSGPQKIANKISVNCKLPLIASSINLDVTNYSTDFPRGFKISFNDKDSSTIYFKEWLGPLRLTEKKLPYFGPQSDVSIQLGKEIEFTNVEIELLKNDDAFDWSVGELNFLN